MANDAIVVGKSLRVNGAKPLDYLNGPYASVEAALTAIPSALRFIGMTVTIITGNTPAEYWFSGGIANENLVAKSSGGGGGGGGDGLNAVEVQTITDETTTVLEEYYTNGGYNLVVVTSTEKAYFRYGTNKWFGVAVGILSASPSPVANVAGVNYISMT